MPVMRVAKPVLYSFLVLLALTGCRSKKELDLYHPGEIQAWREVSTSRQAEVEERPRVELVTSHGTIILELFEEEAPASVANFLEYVNDGFYDGTIIHRVEPGLVIQGGGYTADLEKKETRAPIPNEAENGIRNVRGTLGVARTMEMDSGNSQFYINLTDNPGFNGDGIRDGYAVFGRVYNGMDVVDAIALVETAPQGSLPRVPVEPVVIQSARQIQ